MVNRNLLIVLGLGGAAAAVVFQVTSASTAPAAAPLASVALLAPAARVVAPAASSASPELVRLAARRALYESVDSLLQASELDQARRLLDDDQARSHDDSASEWRDLEQSYRLIADCMERPTAKLRARAKAFVLVSEAQGLKPRVLSACGLPSP